MSIIKRIDDHLEFHQTIIDAIDEKGVFHKVHDRHKADIAFLEAIKKHINHQQYLIDNLMFEYCLSIKSALPLLDSLSKTVCKYCCNSSMIFSGFSPFKGSTVIEKPGRRFS